MPADACLRPRGDAQEALASAEFHLDMLTMRLWKSATRKLEATW